MMLSLPVLVILTCTVTCAVATENSQALNVTVEFPDLPLNVSTTCDFPRQLRVVIKMDDENLTLTLTRNKGVDENADVFVMRTNDGGDLSFVKETLVKIQNAAMYQGDSHEAEFEITCNKSENSEFALVLEGTFDQPSGKMYSLKKSGAIYKLEEEKSDSQNGSDLLHDDNDGDQNVRPVRGDQNVRPVRGAVDPTIHFDVYIDVMALIEHSVYKRWFARTAGSTAALKRTETISNMKRHFAHIFNAVDVRFKTASPHININLRGFIIEDTTSGDWYQNVKILETDQTRVNAERLLNAQYDLSQTPGFPSHDHLISFTSDDMYWSIRNVEDTHIVGFAKLDQMCLENGKSVSAVEYQDNFIKDVSITSHEIAHSLSARHDATDGNSCNGADFIMSASTATSSSTSPFAFSICSAEYFGSYVNTLLEGGSYFSNICLLTSLMTDNVPDVSDEAVGQTYDVHEQCRMIYGPESFHCMTINTFPFNICLVMYCMMPGTQQCVAHYAAQGTTCGDQRWCEAGTCVYSPKAPRADPTCLYGDYQGILTAGKTCPELFTSAGWCTSSRKWCCEWCKQWDPQCTTTCTYPQALDEFLCTCKD